MEQLLVLTDFTDNAANAAAAAVRLCGKLKTDLLLYHSLQSIPIVPDFSGGPYLAEAADILFKDSTEQLNKAAGPLKSLAAQTTGYHPTINLTNGEGSLGGNIKALTDQQNIRMVVMGGRSGGALDHLITGSETAAVIRDAMKPVLIIPKTAELANLKKVVFATDFSAADISALNYLVQLVHSLGSELEVVHVVRPGGSIEVQSELVFRKYLDSLDNYRVGYKQLTGDKVSQRLQDYCRETGVALLAMTHGHHDFISRVFGHSDTKEAIAHQNLAVLIFPPAFKEDMPL